jgi:hypothetical protein
MVCSHTCGRKKHFWVSRVIKPVLPTDLIELVGIGSVFSNTVQVIAWFELREDWVWRRGRV